jgi:tetratricopeptide (TPR) repeat protein
LPDRKAAAVQAYDRAYELQTALVTAYPGNAAYRQELARTHYNRGIVHATAGEAGDSPLSAAETDFRQAVRLLEPLAAENGGTTPAQELARAYNNLANLIAMDGVRLGEAQRLYERAIHIDEGLLAADAGNQQYKLELAQFRKNAADVLRQQGEIELQRGRKQHARDLFERARRRNAEALDLLTDGPRPAPLVAIELADAHHLRGRILEAAESARAVDAYQQSLQLFERMARDPAAVELEQFHIRLAEVLLSVAAWTRNDIVGARVQRLLLESVDWYVALANRSRAAGSQRNAAAIMNNLSRLLPELDEGDRRLILKQHPQLHARLAPGK